MSKDAYDIVIEVEGGVVTKVHTKEPNKSYRIVDWDNADVDEEAEEQCECDASWAAAHLNEAEEA